MIQPLQYQSMFVPTDIGLLNDQIMKRDQEYSQNEMMLASAQDKYAQIDTHPSSVEYKNQLLDQLKSDTNSMIEDYGGDIGAIDKRTLINKMNSIRPQIQDLQRHSMLAEEQRKTASKYGAFADVQNDVSDYETWVNSGRKDSKVGNIGDYQQYVDRGYSDIKSMIRKSGLKEGKIDGMLDNYTIRGIQPEEQETYKQIIKKDLMETSGTTDAIADRLATAKVLELTQGYMKGNQLDPSYNNKAATTSGTGTLVSRTGAGTTTGITSDEKTEMVGNYTSAVAELARAKEQSANAKNTSDYVLSPDVENAANIRYANAMKPFQGDMLNELTKSKKEGGYGLSEAEAIEVVATEKALKPETFGDNVRTEASESNANFTDALGLSIVNKPGKLEGMFIHDTDGNKEAVKRKGHHRDKLTDAIAIGYGKDGGIKNVEFNLKDKEVRLYLDDLTSYSIPIDEIQDKGVSRNLTNYKTIMDVLYGSKTGKTANLKIGNLNVRAEKYFNPETSGYEERMMVIDPATGQEKELEDISKFNNYLFQAVSDTYRDVDYKPQKRN